MGQKFIVFSPYVWVGPLGLLIEGAEHRFRVAKGLPKDARILKCWLYTGPTGIEEIRAVVESSEYPDLLEGQDIPEAIIEIEELKSGQPDRD